MTTRQDRVCARLPMSTLLDYPTKTRIKSKSQQQKEVTELSQKLEGLGVKGSVTNITCGPVLTTYFFKLESKYSTLSSLEEDLALALKADEVRIERAPGTDTVAIEVAETNKQLVTVREVLETPEYFDTNDTGLKLALGQQGDGTSMVMDLAESPHLLVAGATGSGKSVGLNVSIMSLLYRYMPWQLQLGMIDLKRIELGNYEGLPHLAQYGIGYTPQAGINMLEGAVLDIYNRYKVLKSAGVRALGSYLERLESGSLPLSYPAIPYTVLIIDEFAELIMSGGPKVEELVIRISQFGRAAGVHLILATQRPVVKVVTGLIKANIDTRIAFKTTSGIDSRVILDENGAEDLLGKGDGLLKYQGSLTRFQGAYVSSKEIDKVVAFIKQEHSNMS